MNADEHLKWFDVFMAPLNQEIMREREKEQADNKTG